MWTMFLPQLPAFPQSGNDAPEQSRESGERGAVLHPSIARPAGFGQGLASGSGMHSGTGWPASRRRRRSLPVSGTIVLIAAAGGTPFASRQGRHGTRGSKSPPRIGSCLSHEPRISIRTRWLLGTGGSLFRTTHAEYLGVSDIAATRSDTR